MFSVKSINIIIFCCTKLNLDIFVILGCLKALVTLWTIFFYTCFWSTFEQWIRTKPMIICYLFKLSCYQHHSQRGHTKNNLSTHLTKSDHDLLYVNLFILLHVDLPAVSGLQLRWVAEPLRRLPGLRVPGIQDWQVRGHEEELPEWTLRSRCVYHDLSSCKYYNTIILSPG